MLSVMSACFIELFSDGSVAQPEIGMTYYSVASHQQSDGNNRQHGWHTGNDYKVDVFTYPNSWRLLFAQHHIYLTVSAVEPSTGSLMPARGQQERNLAKKDSQPNWGKSLPPRYADFTRAEPTHTNSARGADLNGQDGI